MNSHTQTIYLATDHAGFEHKNEVKSWLTSEGYMVIDYGANTLDPDDDFPDYIFKAASAVSVAPQNKAIIFGGSGQGEAMIANRLRNVRATVYYGGDLEIIRLSRTHNDANILSIGARYVDVNLAKAVIWEWLHISETINARHVRRIKKIESLTKKEEFNNEAH